MRRTFAQLVFLAAAFLLNDQDLVDAQQSTSNVSSEILTDAPCSGLQMQDQESPAPAPAVSIVEVRFLGSLQIPIPDQDQIADSIRQQTNGTSLDSVRDEAVERAREGWQNRGYFKVQLTGETKALSSNPVSQSILLVVHVDEGSRYRLRKITFTHNKGITDVEVLRELFPIKDGEIFSREKIAVGLENLRATYGELGYINFTSVPDTKFDDENQLISLEIEFDEGKQFRVGSINVLGLDDSAREALLQSLPMRPGDIFNSRDWERAFLKQASMFPDCDCRIHEPRRNDEKTGLVTLTFDFRPCSE